jgi:hypothetical protein
MLFIIEESWGCVKFGVGVSGTAVNGFWERIEQILFWANHIAQEHEAAWTSGQVLTLEQAVAAALNR